MHIYVAGPYMANSPVQIQLNVNRAMAAGLYLVKLGHTPFIPHLTHYLEEFARQQGQPLGEAFYKSYDREWLLHCGGLVRLARSPGADAEWEWAGELGIHRWDSLAAVPSAAQLRLPWTCSYCLAGSHGQCEMVMTHWVDDGGIAPVCACPCEPPPIRHIGR